MNFHDFRDSGVEFLEFHARIMKKNENVLNPRQNHENQFFKNSTPELQNYENCIIKFQNNENHEILKIPRQNHENHENLIIPHQNHENHETPKIPFQNQVK